jgi:hypothetical protein
MRDSNPRPLPCKGSTLTTELIALLEWRSLLEIAATQTRSLPHEPRAGKGVSRTPESVTRFGTGTPVSGTKTGLSLC